jgi:general stress protein 26
MTNDDPAKALADLLDPGDTLMVGTSDLSGDWSFRPLTVAAVSDDERIEILLDTNEAWIADLARGDVLVTMGDSRDNTWVWMRGVATIDYDDSEIDRLWNPAAAAYFDNGRESPGIAVLQIEPTAGRYWSTGSGRLGSLLSMVRAKLGSPEQSGEHGDLDV